MGNVILVFKLILLDFILGGVRNNHNSKTHPFIPRPRDNVAMDWIMSTADDATNLSIPLVSIIESGTESGFGVRFVL